MLVHDIAGTFLTTCAPPVMMLAVRQCPTRHTTGRTLIARDGPNAVRCTPEAETDRPRWDHLAQPGRETKGITRNKGGDLLDSI
jgi:hypothetical protein